MRISLEGYGSKIRKVTRCRSTESNETILATKQDIFFTKVAPVQSITDIVILSFWLILLSWMFISSYTTICFFVKNFFLNVYISVKTIFECSYMFFGWEIGHPLSTYATRGMNGVIQNVYRCVQREGFKKSVIRYVRTKWTVPNRCYGIFLCIGLAKYTRASLPARKM